MNEEIFRLQGQELENVGRQVFEQLGLTCFGDLAQARLIELDRAGAFEPDANLEVDYLIPCENICLVGEITGRSIIANVKDKYRKFCAHMNVLMRANLNEALWRQLGVPLDKVDEFREVNQLVGFFISTRFERFDLDLPDTHGIVSFYKSDLELLTDYAVCIGEYGKDHFLKSFNIADRRGMRPLEVNREKNSLIVSQNKQIVSGDVPPVAIFTFEINPYDLLDFAHVYRRDELPVLAAEENGNFQRPLISAKIEQIRGNLLTNPDFMFPNAILAMLSGACSFDEETGTLRIPHSHESISIIDGQHRLYSYAKREIRVRIERRARILVTAILFENATQEEILSYSAKAFVEINRNQSRIQRNHLDAIAYDLLAEYDGRALAAKIILEANKRRGSSLYGLFETNKRVTGVLKATTIITALKPLMNINTFDRLVNVRAGSGNELLRQGYLSFFGVDDIAELHDPAVVISKGVIGLERYFNLVKRTFRRDWPGAGNHTGSSLEYAKVFAGFVRLLKKFIQEGLDWDGIKRELEAIRDNILTLRGMQAYNAVLLDPAVDVIPDANPRDTEDYKFLQRNRERPTSIQEVLN